MPLVSTGWGYQHNPPPTLNGRTPHHLIAAPARAEATIFFAGDLFASLSDFFQAHQQVSLTLKTLSDSEMTQAISLT